MTESPSDLPFERRPLAARQWHVSHVMASWLASRGASPNAISIAGMLAGIAAGICLAATNIAPDWARIGWLLGAGLIFIRGLANMLDGMVAVASGRASRVGELFNEAPDRVSDAAILVGCGYAAGGDPVLGFSAALAAVFTAYVRAIAKVAGSPQDYCGPMAKIQRMAVVLLVALFCGAAPTGWQPLWGQPPKFGLAAVGLSAIIVGCLVTSVRRLLRAAGQLRKPLP
jgi:phosphatidylglycerophosphate synthase